MTDILGWPSLPRIVIILTVWLLYRPETWRECVKCGMAVLLIAFAVGWARAQSYEEGRCEMLRDLAEELGAQYENCAIRDGEPVEVRT